jgi:hypothetical protein
MPTFEKLPEATVVGRVGGNRDPQSFYNGARRGRIGQLRPDHCLGVHEVAADCRLRRVDTCSCGCACSLPGSTAV